MEHVIPGFEKRKVTIDLLKHLATLSLGAIALIGSFLQSLTKLTGASDFLGLIVLAYFLCILSSIISTLIILGNIENLIKIHGSIQHNILRVSYLLAILSFLGGSAGLSYLIYTNVT